MTLLDDSRGYTSHPVSKVSVGISNGKERSRKYLFRTGRIGAEISEKGLLLERYLGEIGDGSVPLTFNELRRLQRATRHWNTEKNDWSLFRESSKGFALGAGSRFLYRAPGRDSEVVEVGRRLMDEIVKGREFKGHDIAIPFTKAVRPVRAVSVIAEIWRKDEVVGNPDGEKVGVIYKLSPKITVQAYRDILYICILPHEKLQYSLEFREDVTDSVYHRKMSAPKDNFERFERLAEEHDVIVKKRKGLGIKYTTIEQDESVEFIDELAAIIFGSKNRE